MPEWYVLAVVCGHSELLIGERGYTGVFKSEHDERHCQVESKSIELIATRSKKTKRCTTLSVNRLGTLVSSLAVVVVASFTYSRIGCVSCTEIAKKTTNCPGTAALSEVSG